MLVVGVVFVFTLVGCNGPFLLVPGGRLAGVEAPLDLTELPSGVAVLQLETQTDRAYSVNLGFRNIEDQIYIDPTAGRRWYQHIQSNPNVRIRFAGQRVVHPVRAEVVTDAEILSLFAPDRIVIRLTPRA
jgi:hypothetical protein